MHLTHYLYFTLSMNLLACGEKPDNNLKDGTVDGEITVDADGDGYLEDEDCDDNNPAIYPSAEEVCDGFDNDCDAQADEDVQSIFYADSDNDGFGNENLTIYACEVRDGYVANGSDCDDTNSNSFPGAEEICDGFDNDCNTEVDDGIGEVFFTDADGDGFGDANQPIEACDLRVGLSFVDGDCDDTSAQISPAMDEICDEIDNDCNGNIDEGVTTTYYFDNDSDGFGDSDQTIEACSSPVDYVDNPDDCDDVETYVNPAENEICDTVDNDCDEEIDEEDAVDAILWFVDADSDGFGSENTTTTACFKPDFYVSNTDDCDDTQSNINPSAEELCDGFDNNCDQLIDDTSSSDASIFYVDADGDGFGDPNNSTSLCYLEEGYSTDQTDCNDQNNLVFPEQDERCNEIDDDCDEEIDEEAIDTLILYEDQDGDGFGNIMQLSCDMVDGFALNDGDCDDENDTIGPIAEEICDEVDNNCDEVVDEGVVNIIYIDNDGDGFGGEQQSVCEILENHSLLGGDCDDSTELRSPSLIEVCDEIDNDCDDEIDEGVSLSVFIDNDGDGFGITEIEVCSLEENHSLLGGDCDDSTELRSPSLIEVCDEIDNDCDDEIDESGSFGEGVWYLDEDQDGFGQTSVTITTCFAPDNYVSVGGDCDDDSDVTFPNADEICDAMDNNCNEKIDDGVDVGVAEACAATTCQEVTGVSGLYWIDPLEEGEPYQTYCLTDDVYDGGGWTLVATVSDDGQNTWTWNERRLWDTNTLTFGNVTDIHLDFKSPAFHDLNISDILFVHSPSDVWAAYNDISNSQDTLGEIITDAGEQVAYNMSSGYSLSAGNLSEQSLCSSMSTTSCLCNTNLVFNACSKDANNSSTSCTDVNDSHGPVFNVSTNQGCPYDDPDVDGNLGPATGGNVSTEQTDLGYGNVLGLNTGSSGLGENYMQIFVR